MKKLKKRNKKIIKKQSNKKQHIREYYTPKERRLQFLKYQYLVYKIAKGFYTQIEQEDANQIGLMQLWRATKLYNPSSKTTHFITYAYRAIKNEIMKHLNVYTVNDVDTNTKRIVNKQQLRESSINKQDLITHHEEEHIIAKDTVKTLLSKLNREERWIIKRVYGINTKKLSILEIAKKKHLRRQDVYTKRNKIIKKLRLYI